MRQKEHHELAADLSRKLDSRHSLADGRMIIYEVTTKVRSDLISTYEAYMIEQHIPDVVATGRFVRASLEYSGDGAYRIRYEATGREHLESYLEHDAPRLRRDFLNYFPEGIDVSRTEWMIIRTFA